MRRFVLAVGIGVAMASVGVGVTMANAGTHGASVETVTAVSNTTQASAAAVGSDAPEIPPATVTQRRANETKDGDPRVPAKWGPAQFESFSVAARGVFAKLGQVDPVSAQREGTTDTYQIIVKAKDGHEYLVKVDYLRFQFLSAVPLG